MTSTTNIFDELVCDPPAANPAGASLRPQRGPATQPLPSDAALDPAHPLAQAPPLNRQEYANSPLSGSNIEQHSLGNEDAMFNQKAPNLAILHEKPEHRIALFLKAQGCSNKEIAEKTGYTYPWVSQLMRQPWARQRLVKEISAAGRDVVKELIASAASDSVFKLIELRDTADNESVQRAASDSLLDRFLGKPTQKIEQQNTEMPTSIAALDQELLKLKAMEKEVLGGSQN